MPSSPTPREELLQQFYSILNDLTWLTSAHEHGEFSGDHLEDATESRVVSIMALVDSYTARANTRELSVYGMAGLEYTQKFTDGLKTEFKLAKQVTAIEIKPLQANQTEETNDHKTV